MKRHGLWIALLLALLVRLPALALATEHYGDSPVRIETAERWAHHPHLWNGFRESFQYGPLHLSLLGAALRVVPDRQLAPKLLSLAFGLLSVALLYALTRRIRGPEAALLAACALALSPLHIQASTTGASEVPFLALLLATIVLVLREQPAVVASALLLGAAGLIRYDGWLYVPLIGGVLLWRSRSLVRAFVFCAVATLPAVLWMLRNWQAAGDPLAPIHWIDHDHHVLARMGLTWLGPIGYRLYCLPYWPEAVLLIATPVVGLLALAGAARALWRRDAGWELAALAWIPGAYFTFRGAVLADFRPMVRFAMVAATFSLPYAWDAVLWLGERARRSVIAAAAVAMIATPAALVAVSYGKNGTLAEWARPVSPISTVPPGIAQAVRWLKQNAQPADVILLDGVWDYLDIPLAFATDFPDDRWLRLSWTEDFEQRWARHQPTLAVVLYQGTLEKQLGNGDRITYRSLDFCVQQRFVYATIYRRCDLAAVSQGARR